MALKNKQRRRTARTRSMGPTPRKWPETMEELNALAPSNLSAVSVNSVAANLPYNPAAVRPGPAQYAQQQSAQQPLWTPAPQTANDMQVRQRLPNAPYLSLTGRGPLQISTPATAQRTLFGYDQDNIPSPEPGPPPDYGQQKPEAIPTQQPHQAPTTSVNYKPGMVEIGAAAAQQIMEKRNKELQEWGRLAAIAPALGLPVPPAPNWSGKQSSGLQQDQQATQPTNNTMGINTDELAALALDQVGKS